MADRIQIRRDIAANWANVNPVLAQGEMGLETDTEKMKIGDGVTAYNDLNYFVTSQTNVEITGGTIDSTTIGSITPTTGSFTNITVSGTVDGRDIASDGSKLDGIEDGATADQTKADIDALGIDAVTVNGLTVETAVPTGAVFTDTETTTSLDIVANELRYTDEEGTVSTIDLSLYLDGTNLARIVSGSYDSDNQELVFTRDDSSEFRIDASMFFDDTNLVTSVAGKTGSVNLVASDISDLTATTTELNYVDGVTSPIQTQLNAKAPINNPSFTGDANFDSGTLFVDASTNNVGIGTSSPTQKLDVNGSIKASGIYLGGTGAENYLDDYEEGTWTPTIVGDNGGSLTLVASSATYVKIGKTVHVFWHEANWTANSGLSGLVQIGGLPFTSSNNFRSLGGFGGSSAGSMTFTGVLVPALDPNTKNCWIIYKDPTNNTYSHTPTFASSGIIYGFSLTYTTDS